jgi:cellulose 1,4-beta-cellobiosidase
MITNMNVAKCARAAPYYESLTVYALKTLNLPNVDMYLDGGHAGWLGWEANIAPAAKFYAKVYKAAGSPRGVRGIVTNVSNYNPFRIVDVGRSGKQPTGQQEWGDWCNVQGAGFGARPTTNTGNDLVDAFVWVKPGGEVCSFPMSKK